MRTKVILALAVVLMLIVSTAAIGSNMGFKISIPLVSGITKTNWVSIPFYNSYADATALFNDVPNCSQVSRWNSTTRGYETWNGSQGVNFAITPGEAYQVKVSTNSTWVVVGSHNPSLAVSMASGITKTNWVSIPYHTTATKASELFPQIPNCSQVSRWNSTTRGYETWNGSQGVDFPITPGEGLQIKVSVSGSWAPAHY